MTLLVKRDFFDSKFSNLTSDVNDLSSKVKDEYITFSQLD
jgi:hypothetical protein